ncbi:diacylglycerol kinase delta [Trichonephila inaurata madagascariensis]|uniref:Diacylglycerol kinase n=3 Tax=Nephilidae TaxID=450948 RepID=A0A8X7C1N9_9ARAC|nr:diacylglycerol kinase delta [Trichonephila inaurata madagascariensis]
MATGSVCGANVPEKTSSDAVTDESSESDGEPSSTKSFQRRISTSKAIKTGVCIKEGYLMKQIGSFQRWRRRYFKIKPRKLYFAKDSKSGIFEEVDLTDLSIAECSIKNVNHSFEVITPFQKLILCTESRREMEDWITAFKNVSNKDFYEGTDNQEFLSGQHNWCITNHARPTFCNVCRDALPGVRSTGLSCEVCKFKAHKRCAIKAPSNCKWTTLSSVGKDIIEDEDINLAMPHQWLEGNLPVSAKCSLCDKTCGSVLKLQDWKCLWCRALVHHTTCKAQYPQKCPLGVCRASIVPPTSLHSISNDESWEAICPLGCSPLLVFVNSKSGDNQGVMFLRRFKQLLNPAQVFDLMNGGPRLGLQMFRTFNPLRVLVCGGDGSVSWVLTEIDKLNMNRQCQVGVLPLGTGNDLARVLGWGSSCNDDAQLPQMLENYEKATVKSLDRWCIMTYEKSVLAPRKSSGQKTEDLSPSSSSDNDDSVDRFIATVFQSDQPYLVISSLNFLLKNGNKLLARVTAKMKEKSGSVDEDICYKKFQLIMEKLGKMLLSMTADELASKLLHEQSEERRAESPEVDAVQVEVPPSQSKKVPFVEREALMSRTNSLKKAVWQIFDCIETVVDEQNAENRERDIKKSPEPSFPMEKTYSSENKSDSTLQGISDEERLTRPESLWNPWGSSMGHSIGASLKDTLQVTLPTIQGGASADSSPCPSPHPIASPSMSVFSSPSKEKPTVRLSLELSHTTDISHFPSHSGTEDSITACMTGTKPSEAAQSPTATRRISSGAILKSAGTSNVQSSFGIDTASNSCQSFERSLPESYQVEGREFPIINPLTSIPLWSDSNKDISIEKALLPCTDALCAAASPLMDVEDISLEGFDERCVMNNYFGIGVDAKITLEFHNKREEHPEKCRSRTRNLMWYGVLGGKELLHQTYKNLEQRVELECDGKRIPLPSLQGIVVLNINSYGGGSNFWGGTKEDDVFVAPAFDDKILEVVAVYGTVQMAASRVINLQHHRIAQCRSVKIIIKGVEGVPVQVDGEAWIQPPGYICIIHKNQTQVLCRNKQLESSSKMLHDKRNSNRSMPLSPLTDEEIQLIGNFTEAVLNLIRSIKIAAVSYSKIEEDLLHVAMQVANHIERLYPGGKLIEGAVTRQILTELVVAARHLLQDVSAFLRDKNDVFQADSELEEKLTSLCQLIEKELRNCSENQGWVFFHSEEPVNQEQKKHYKGLFKLKFLSKQAKSKTVNSSSGQNSGGACNCSNTGCEGSGCGTPTEEVSSLFGDLPLPSVLTWRTSEVALWLESIQMGEYKDNFITHDIQGPELLHLERRDLKELGVTKVGHIKRILQAVKDISTHSIGRKLALL